MKTFQAKKTLAEDIWVPFAVILNSENNEGSLLFTKRGESVFAAFAAP